MMWETPVPVPEAFVRQFYVAGSLRNTAAGWALDAQNPLGDGTVVGVGPIAVDGQDVLVEALRVRIVLPDETEPAAEVGAADVNRFAPLRFRRGDRLVLTVGGEPLAPGEHEIDLTLIELNLGGLRLRIVDSIGA
jgi:hypothetical protein